MVPSFRLSHPDKYKKSSISLNITTEVDSKHFRLLRPFILKGFTTMPQANFSFILYIFFSILRVKSSPYPLRDSNPNTKTLNHFIFKACSVYRPNTPPKYISKKTRQIWYASPKVEHFWMYIFFMDKTGRKNNLFYSISMKLTINLSKTGLQPKQPSKQDSVVKIISPSPHFLLAAIILCFLWSAYFGSLVSS